MTTSPGPEELDRVVQRLDPRARLLGSRVVQGGTSAQVVALDVRRSDGADTRLILRRYGDFALRQDPLIAEHEFRLLRLVHTAGVPTPLPHGFDQTGAILGRPYIVMDYVDGAPEFAPADLDALIRQLAAQLAAIHGLDLDGPDLGFLPRIDDLVAALLRRPPAALDDTLDEGRIREALERHWPPGQRNPSVLLHGDLWPGNVLFRDGRLAAVIDWEDAALGDPLADLANSRLEVLWAYGSAAMEAFTARYRSLRPIDVGNLACWELWAALRPAGHLAEYAEGNPGREAAMRAAHHAFVARALTARSERSSS